MRVVIASGQCRSASAPVPKLITPKTLGHSFGPGGIIGRGPFFAAKAAQQSNTLYFLGLCMSFWAMKEYVTLLKTRPAESSALGSRSAIPIPIYG